jgi:RNA polymerase sigma-70 factor, ECF subfamily
MKLLNRTESLEDKWMREAQEGNKLSFEKIVTQHRTRIETLCQAILKGRADHEQIADDAFIRAWTHIHTYRPGSVLKWLEEIAKNACIDELKKRSSQNLPLTEDREENQARSFQDPLVRVAIWNTLMKLTKEERVVFCLCYYCEMTHKEIADIMDISPKTVQRKIEKILPEMRKTLKDFLSS